MHARMFICSEREYLQAAKLIKDTNKRAKNKGNNIDVVQNLKFSS